MEIKMRQLFRRAAAGITVFFSAVMLCSCLHAVQETTCKSKFKKKYNCPFGKISIVDNELTMGNHIKLRGCGKTVIYDGTKEDFVED
jgi:hypothetical protein